MAQGAKKFKAQRPGLSKKQHNNKPKGPKKGGSSCFIKMWPINFLFFSQTRERARSWATLDVMITVLLNEYLITHCLYVHLFLYRKNHCTKENPSGPTTEAEEGENKLAEIN